MKRTIFHKCFSCLLLMQLFLQYNCKSTNKVKVYMPYPSDFYTPSMNVYLKNLDTKDIYSYISKENENTHEFDNIPTGRYIAYLTLNDLNTNFKAGYTKYVICGSSINCKDHTLVEFTVPIDEKEKVEISDYFISTDVNF